MTPRLPTRLSLPSLLALLLALAAPVTHAHGGDAPPARAAEGPQRLSDGSVFLPKPAQRLLGLRTQPVLASALPRSLELPGTVVMDPNSGGQVQATQSGRLVAPPGGFVAPGQRVQRGQVLAYVEPLVSALEQGTQSAQLAEWRALLGLAEQRVQRLRQLSDTVPRRELEAAEAELTSLRSRIQALAQGLTGREALRAPVAGVIASAQAVAGQLVEARERLFEVIDPQRLRIEALAHDPQQAADIGAAFLKVEAGQAPPLRFLGAASRLREQALPLSFALSPASGQSAAPPTLLALGQTVRVVLQSRSTVPGHAVPAEALAKSPSNQAIVWVKQAPERFEPRLVQVQALDGRQVAITQGLQDGDRVVVQGASLLNQVR